MLKKSTQFKYKMAITEKELKELIDIDSSVDRISNISSDGRNLLLRIPKEVREFLDLKKGDKLRWVIDENKKIKIEVIRQDAEKKKTGS